MPCCAWPICALGRWACSPPQVGSEGGRWLCGECAPTAHAADVLVCPQGCVAVSHAPYAWGCPHGALTVSCRRGAAASHRWLQAARLAARKAHAAAARERLPRKLARPALAGGLPCLGCTSGAVHVLQGSLLAPLCTCRCTGRMRTMCASCWQSMKQPRRQHQQQPQRRHLPLPRSLQRTRAAGRKRRRCCWRAAGTARLTPAGATRRLLGRAMQSCPGGFRLSASLQPSQVGGPSAGGKMAASAEECGTCSHAACSFPPCPWACAVRFSIRCPPLRAARSRVWDHWRAGWQVGMQPAQARAEQHAGGAAGVGLLRAIQLAAAFFWAAAAQASWLGQRLV